MTEKKIKELIFRSVAIMYMVALTIFISNYILKVFEAELWENERAAMRAFIVIGMLVSLVYLSIKEKNIVEIQAVGAGAINQAVKAVAIARGFVAPTGVELTCSPAFTEVSIDNEEKTARCF